MKLRQRAARATVAPLSVPIVDDGICAGTAGATVSTRAIGPFEDRQREGRAVVVPKMTAFVLERRQPGVHALGARRPVRMVRRCEARTA